MGITTTRTPSRTIDLIINTDHTIIGIGDYPITTTEVHNETTQILGIMVPTM